MFGFAQILLFWMCVNVSCSDIEDIHSITRKNKYFTGKIIKTLSPIGFIQCQSRCYRHTDCKSINYHKDHLYCELKKMKANDTSNLEDKEGYLYNTISKSEFKNRMTDEKPCYETTCLENAQCINLKQKKAVCVREKCKRSDYIMGANVGWCLKFHQTSKTFSTANITCQEEEARLVVPNTEEKLKYIVDNYLANKYLETSGWWIGATKVSPHNWQYTNGEAVISSVGWSKIIENEDDGHCLAIWKRTFNDAPCNVRYSFICEEAV